MSYEEIHEVSVDLAEIVKASYTSWTTRDVPNFDIGEADRLMEGAIEIHVHPGPDAWATRLPNDIELAIEACRWGMQAVVFKCHSAPTARCAQLTQFVVNQWAKEHSKKSTKVLGGIVLMYNVGGLNPEAVETTARLGGKFIWTPNLDASHQHKLMGQAGGIEVLDSSGRVVPELIEIFKLIAEYDLVLSISHQSTRERFTMIDAAKEVGVRKIELVHVNAPITKLTIDQMKIATEKGAYLGLYCFDFKPPNFSLEEALKAIQEVGAEHFVLGTDLGNWKMPDPIPMYRRYLGLLLDGGIPEADVKKMSSFNAERLIWG